MTASLTSAISLLAQLVASIAGLDAPSQVPLNGLTLVLADQLNVFFTSFLSPKTSERQAPLPAGRQPPFGLVTREFLKFVSSGGIGGLATLPVFKHTEGANRVVPKEPISTRDLGLVQMQIRDRVIELVMSIFKRHGSVSIETPVFELSEVLFGKYGEDGAKLIYDLADQGRKLLSLRCDLAVPFAR
jgi:hypothetical protein